ncbi:MAG: hypothetical protein IIA62_03320 [Nitrospinae bacterium]|nr:hypothetical protein [Nitrospinota bacterium]
MSIHCTAHHGFRYCADVPEDAEMKTRASHLEGWKRFFVTLMITVFFLILFIML